MRGPALWSGVGALTLLAGILGYSLGTREAAMDEGRAIDLWAARHAERSGGARTDCVGVPGEGPVWIVVRCRDAGGEAVYPLDRGGRLMAPEPAA